MYVGNIKSLEKEKKILPLPLITSRMRYTGRTVNTGGDKLRKVVVKVAAELL
jgi:hypothetical protein